MTRLEDYQREAASGAGRGAVSRARAALRKVPHDAPAADKAEARRVAEDLLGFTPRRVAVLVGDETVLGVCHPDARFALVKVPLDTLEVVDRQHPLRMKSLRQLPVEQWKPIVTWDEVVVDGSHRVALAREYGLTHLPSFARQPD